MALDPARHPSWLGRPIPERVFVKTEHGAYGGHASDQLPARCQPRITKYFLSGTPSSVRPEPVARSDADETGPIHQMNGTSAISQ